MLRVIVKKNVTGCESFASAIVIFDVIGAKGNFAVLDEDVFIGDEEVALFDLRAVGGDFNDFALTRGKTDQLAACRRRGS